MWDLFQLNDKAAQRGYGAVWSLHFPPLQDWQRTKPIILVICSLQKAYVLNQEETTKCNDFVRQLIDLAKAKKRRKKKDLDLFKHSKAELESRCNYAELKPQLQRDDLKVSSEALGKLLFFPSNARWLSPGRLSSRKTNCIVQIYRINAVATSVITTMWYKRELNCIDT